MLGQNLPIICLQQIAALEANTELPKSWRIWSGGLIAFFALGLILPDDIKNPVTGATRNDWNHETFWYEPWGASVVHKGIDIFGKKGSEVVAPTYGITVYTGNLSLGGNVIAILGPKWRIHYFAHMESIETGMFEIVGSKERIGTLGDSGNASGKQPHVHYSIVTLFPHPWLASTETQGWKKMFFLNPQDYINGL